MVFSSDSEPRSLPSRFKVICFGVVGVYKKTERRSASYASYIKVAKKMWKWGIRRLMVFTHLKLNRQANNSPYFKTYWSL